MRPDNPWLRRRTPMIRIAIATAMMAMVSACSGPFFYRDVIVPTDPNRRPAAQAQP